MLAFQPYHSLIEMRRYAVRFMHQLHLIKSLRGILRTKYDQYNSLIRPLQEYLAGHGVVFVAGTTVTDMDIDINGCDKTVTALHLKAGDKEEVLPISEKDIVFFTNGSMTQNSTQGSMTEAPVMNRDMENMGCFTLWKKLAAKCPEYGNPEKFAFDPDKSNFVSCTVTVRDYPQFFDYLAEKTGNLTGKGGCSTFVDAPWFINYKFVELEGDVVFTVETSVRTAMIAVYRMLELDCPITPLFQGQYDIRMVNVALKTLLGKDEIEVSDLPKINPLKLPQTMREIVDAINQIPPVPEYYSERKENVR